MAEPGRHWSRRRGGRRRGRRCRPSAEVESTYQAPVATGHFVWIANPTSGRVAYVDAQSLAVTTVEAGNGPTYLAAVPGADDAVIVLNTLSNDATYLRANGATLESRTIEGVAAGSNAWAVSPDGRFAIAWTDARLVPAAPVTQGFHDVTIIDLQAAATASASTTLAVGYRPVSISFGADSSRAFAVTEDGVSVVALATGAVVDTVPLGANGATDPEDTHDVSITPDGRLAVVRRDGSAIVAVVDLASHARSEITLSGAVTDVDVSADGARAVAVVRATAEVTVLPLAGHAPAAGDVTHVTIAGETIGQVTLTAGGTVAVLYSNALSSQRLTVLTLSATPAFHVVRLHAPVLSALPTPDGKFAVVLHPVDTGADGGVSADAGGGATQTPAVTPDATAFSLVPLDGTQPARIEMADAPIQAVAMAPAEQPRAAHRARRQASDLRRLPRPPAHARGAALPAREPAHRGGRRRWREPRLRRAAAPRRPHHLPHARQRRRAHADGLRARRAGRPMERMMNQPRSPRATAAPRALVPLLCLGLAALGCGGRSPTWSAPVGNAQAFGLKSAVVLVDPPAHRAVALAVDASGALTQTSLPTGHGVVATAVGPKGGKLYVLSAGHQGGLGDSQADEHPSLTIIDGTTTPATAREILLDVLSDPLDGLAIDPTEQWAVVYAASGTGTAFVTNPNELVIVDLSKEKAQAVVLHSFGGHPERLIFAPPLMLPAGLGHLLVVQSDQDFTLLSLDDPTKPDITVRLADATAVSRPHPAEVVFDDGDPAKTDDARIGVRFDGADERHDAAARAGLEPQRLRAHDQRRRRGRRPERHRVRAHRRRAAPRRRSCRAGRAAVLVDPVTTTTSMVALPAGYRSLSLVTASTIAPAAAAAGPDLALLWNGTTAARGASLSGSSVRRRAGRFAASRPSASTAS